MQENVPPISEELHQLMAEVGPTWGSRVQANVRLMVEKFSEIQAYAPKLGKVIKNISYGLDPRHVLDIYQPLQAEPNAPVVLFVHGGAFVDGSKDRTEEIYSNVLWYFARHGILGVNVEFRLAPTHQFPAGTQDIAAAVAWVRTSISTFGGNPDNVFLMGHSAGAAHSAHYAYDRRHHPEEGHGLVGLIVVSGRVRAEVESDNPNADRVKAYYGDKSNMLYGSSVEHVDATSVPTMVAMAEYENPLIDMHCVELVHKLASVNRKAPRFLWMPKHNHTSIIAHINTSEDQLGQGIRDFIKNPR